MKILFNFAPLKKGGGQNVALNFLGVAKAKGMLSEHHYLVAEGSLIHKFLMDNSCINFTAISGNPVTRTLFEAFSSRRLLKKNRINLIYSYFGVGVFPSKYPQVIGSADSNLYFPEIDFWKGYTGISLLAKKAIDKFRIWGLHRAEGIIFENGIMETKCHELFKVKALTTTILPSINLDFPTEEYELPAEAVGATTRKGLFLCGWHLNKNVMIIPHLAKEMKDRNIDFHFLLTAPEDQSDMHRQFMHLVGLLQVEDRISIVGPIHKERLKSLYEQIDFVFLLSKLESFSNNIIEAWAYKRVLVVADEPWARALCKDAAAYVEREDGKQICDTLQNLINQQAEYHLLVEKGQDAMSAYPTIEEKYNQEMQFLKKVYESN